MNRDAAPVAGFTLLEVLMAMAVLVIGLSAMWLGVTRGYNLTTGLPDRMMAKWVAANRLVEMQAGGQWPVARTYAGTEMMGGRQWYWEEQITATEEPMMRRVMVRVGAGENKLTLFNLEGYLIRPRPPFVAARRMFDGADY
jgi:general secretion pathway protein I